MSNVKISELAIAASPLSGLESVVMNQNGVTVTAVLSNIKAYANEGGGGGGGDVYTDAENTFTQFNTFQQSTLFSQGVAFDGGFDAYNTLYFNSGVTYDYAPGIADVHKTALSLNNVDNTSDVNKPVSTAQQTALDLKSDLTKVNTLSTRVNTLSATSNNLIALSSNWQSTYNTVKGLSSYWTLPRIGVNLFVTGDYTLNLSVYRSYDFIIYSNTNITVPSPSPNYHQVLTLTFYIQAPGGVPTFLSDIDGVPILFPDGAPALPSTPGKSYIIQLTPHQSVCWMAEVSDVYTPPVVDP